MTQTGSTRGMIAPDFTLLDSSGRDWKLSDQRGKVVVLLFYPADETPTCTKQMCSVRDRWSDYLETGAEVVGISTDSVKSHQSFADNHQLPLRLLSDPDQKVARLYRATSFIPGKSARAVFVIDADGRISYRHQPPLINLFVAPKDDETIAAIRAAMQEQKKTV